MRTSGPAHFLRLYSGENDRYQGRPLYEEVVRRLTAAGAEPAIVYRGVEGYGASTLVHRPGWFGRSTDAPIVVTAVASEAVLERLRPSLEEIVGGGLIAISKVEVIRYQEE